MSEKLLLQKALQSLQEKNRKISEYERERSEPIAVTGMGCRFPGGVQNPADFWQLLKSGKNAISKIPDERKLLYGDNYGRDTEFIEYAGLVDHVDHFDPQFFKISAREAKSMDPQHRLLLEVSWEALEDAGSVNEGKVTSTGVFVGITQLEYGTLIASTGITDQVDSFFTTGSLLNAAAGRISYTFGFEGPCMAVDTACSSSLVSVHLACQSLRNRECDQALAGGVNLLLTPFGTIATTKAKMLAPDGKCKVFDEAADGYVRGEGCGIVILKRLSDAIKDGDNIKAVIRGSGVSQDGASSGLTVPNGTAQKRLIEDVLRKSGMLASDLDYVEAHGTGTSLGDPIEFNTLCNVFANSHSKNQPLKVGAVKSNIGHLESAAGIAGLIKVILALQHEEIPSNLHFKNPSRHINWTQSPLQVVDKNVSWEKSERKRIAGVSSFGFSGTNCHVVIEEVAAGIQLENDPNDLKNKEKQVLCLSAKGPEALKAVARQYAIFLDTDPKVSLPEICRTAGAYRNHYTHRLAVTSASKEDLKDKLTQFVHGELASHLYSRDLQTLEHRPKIAFLFSGQGTQYPGMCKDLFDSQPLFRQNMEKCAEILFSYLDQPLLDVIYPADNNNELIHDTCYTQPALFSIEYSLAQLWRSWGIEPQIVMGHSVGEYVAACIAGILSLQDALKLIAFRGQLLHTLADDGGMLMVLAHEDIVKEALIENTGDVSIAAVNGENHTVLSGKKETLQKLELLFGGKNIHSRWMPVSKAFHSPLVEPILSQFRKAVQDIKFHDRQMEIVSNLTGDLAYDPMQSPDYWVRQVREPVRYYQGIKTLVNEGVNIFLEIGPSATLTSTNKKIQFKDEVLCLSSVTSAGKEWETLLKGISKLYTRGIDLNWMKFYGKGYGKSNLPTYPFQRKPYWFDERIAYKEPARTHTIAPTTEFQKKAIANVTNISSIKSALVDIVAKLLEEDPADINTKTPLLEMGADSILLMDAGKTIESTFGLEIPLRQFFDELKDIEALTEYIAARIQPAEPQGDTSDIKTALTKDTQIQLDDMLRNGRHGGDLDAIIAAQLSLNAKIISLLSQENGRPNDRQEVMSVQSKKYQIKSEATDVIDPLATFRNRSSFDLESSVSLEERRNQGLSKKQRDHLEKLTSWVNSKTSLSKKFTEESRRVFADNRSSAGFRFTTKEMLYPIVGKRSEGSRVWDLDGNEYLDISMGFGVNLFGHNPAFIKNAIQKQLAEGMQLGPQAELAATVAQHIADLTGVERVAFCNSGTEAVMTAMRLARATTGKRKIALFAGSYHGHFDGVLGSAKSLNENPEGTSVIPGVTDSYIRDLIVLDYGNPISLELLDKYRDDLAGVLVEPVQSRRPNLQPVEFLKALKTFTREAGVPLIFDEVITGFRIHPGGAQAYFDIKADIAVYGKVIGGGMPIGIVAGDASYMDALDGGLWNYGDTTYPQVETTFFAGTFCKHPLTMAASLAVLRELKEKGPALQEKLNTKTTQLASDLNSYFNSKSLAIEIVNFGSLFRFASKGNIDLLFYNLLARGIYVWEGRNFFLSTAHTDEDIALLISRVKESVEALEEAGFLDTMRKKSEDNATELYLFGENSDVEIALTTAQKQLWTLSQMDVNGWIAYNIPSNLVLNGKFDDSKVQQTLDILAGRHESLRSTLNEEGTAMNIRHTVDISCEYIDISDQPDNEKGQWLQQWNLAESKKPFAVSNEVLYRFVLIKFSETKHVLSLTVHHIMFDGWSVIVLLKELAQIYSSLCKGEAITLQNPMQFRELIHLRDSSDLEKKMRSEAYWTNKFADAIPTLDLPLDYPRPLMKTFRGSRISRCLDKDIIDRIKVIGNKQQSTLFVTLLAAYTVFLRKLSGQDDFVIGIPSSGRSIKNSETVAGYCSQLLPIENHFSETLSFSDHLRNTRNLLLEGFEHDDFPFAELIEKLKEKENVINNPLNRATFNMDPMDPFPKLHGLEAEFAPTPLSYMAYDITLSIIELEDGFNAEWNYNTDLFNEETIHQYSDYFQQLLQQIARAPEQKISNLSLLSAEQQALLESRWCDNTVALPDEASVQALFEKQAAASPENIALKDHAGEWTYRELNEAANQWGHYFRKSGVEPGDTVAVYLAKSVEMVAVLLGIMKAGAAFVGIDPLTPVIRLKHILDDSDPAVVITQKQLRPSLSEINAEIISVEEVAESVRSNTVDNLAIPASSEELIYIVYTSGSTGTPKGIRATQKGVINYLLYIKNIFGLCEKDIVLQLAPIGFDAAVRDIFAPLIAGAKVVIGVNSRDIPQLNQAIESDAVTCLLSTVPSLLSGLVNIANQQIRDVSSVRLILTSGEILRTALATKVLSVFPGVRLVNQYGPTECTMTSTYYEVEQTDNSGNSISIGAPIPNAEVYIVADEVVVPDGVVGELCIGGVGVSKGYLNKLELTTEKFVTYRCGDGTKKLIYKTGDLARFNADGTLELFGRMDNQVKVRGFRIELDEVEAAILHHPAIGSCAALLVNDKNEEAAIHAYIVADDQAVTTSDLVNFLTPYLPEHAIPSKFIVIDQLPLTINGKVDKKALSDRGAELMSSVGVSMPANAVEEKLLSIWQQVLARQEVGTNDDFFKVGGNSLKAIQLIGRIHKEYNRLLTVADIFAHQTIVDLGRLLMEKEVAEYSSIEPQPEKETYDLSYAQHNLWVADQLVENQVAYNVSGMLIYEDKVDEKAFIKAFEELVKRHESLRTIFVTVGDRPQQKILPFDKTGFKVEYIDLSGLEDEAIEQRVKEEKIQQPFELSQGPLLRVKLLKLGVEKYAILCSTHHIISDGWSMNVLLKEVFQRYHAFKSKLADPFAPLKVHYKDYAAWQNTQLKSDNLLKLQAFWDEYFEGNLSLLKLPYDKKRPKHPSFHGQVIQFDIETSLAEKMRQVSRENAVTLFSTLMAAVKILLFRYSGQDDVIVGIPFSSRDRRELEEQIGFYINTVVFRSRFDHGDSIGQFLKKTQANMLEVHKHALYPFSLLLERFQKNKRLEGDQLFNVMIQIQDTHQSLSHEKNISYLRERVAGTNRGISKFDLTFNFTLTDAGNILADIEYNTDLFLDATIEKLRDDLLFLLDQLANQPNLTVSSQDLLPLYEKEDTLNEFLKPLDEM